MPPSPLGPAYRITTRRLLLRCWDPADTPALLSLLAANVDHLRPWVPWMAMEPQPLDAKLREVRKWRADFDTDAAWHYAMYTGDGRTLLGAVILNRRDWAGGLLGGWIGKESAGRGYHTEAAAAVARAAFELLGMWYVEASCRAENAPSMALLRKLGFRHMATLGWPLTAAPAGELVWRLHAPEFPLSPAAGHAVHASAWDALGNRMM